MSSSLDDPSNLLAPDAVADALECVNFRFVSFRQYGPAAATAAAGRPLPGWSVTAISGDRAWLKTPKGQAVTVVAGERLKGAGAVRAVDAIQKIVVMGDGRVVR